VFVTGESDGPLQDHGKTNAYATVAYHAATGKQLWASRHNGHGTFDNFDFAKAIAVSPDGGTVFVTGQGAGKSSLSGYTTVAYSAATGEQEWVRNYNGEAANALAISPDGRTLFVTGNASRKPYGIAYETIAYDARTGAQRWVRFYAGPAGNTGANAVQVSSAGRTRCRTCGRRARGATARRARRWATGCGPGRRHGSAAPAAAGGRRVRRPGSGRLPCPARCAPGETGEAAPAADQPSCQ